MPVQVRPRRFRCPSGGMVDTGDLKSPALYGRAGSIPVLDIFCPYGGIADTSVSRTDAERRTGASPVRGTLE